MKVHKTDYSSDEEEDPLHFNKQEIDKALDKSDSRFGMFQLMSLPVQAEINKKLLMGTLPKETKQH